MSKKTHLPIPVQNVLRILGKNISDARRRRIAMELMSERCGFSRLTLSKLEKGDPSVSMGAYAFALFVLGMSEHLTRVADASHAIVGCELEEESVSPKKLERLKGKPMSSQQIYVSIELTNHKEFSLAESIIDA